MTDRELISGLDACRPGSDDLGQPELRAVAEHVAADGRAQAIRVRIERIDSAVSRAMHDLPLPDGYAARQLARLHEAAQEAAIGDGVGTDLLPASVAPAISVGSTSRSRRRFLVWSSGVVTAAAAIFVAVILLRPEKPLVAYDLESSRQWHDQLAADGDWLPFHPNELSQHALPSELRLLPHRYRDASSVVGREARAYDLSQPGRPATTLFVIPQVDRAGVPSSPPRAPETSTLGLAVAYWQTGGYIYVVVLQSDRIEDYQQLLRTSSPAAA
jgi:hypothetical protein